MDAMFYVLFDGVCNLCNSTVQFIIRNDRRGRFRFAALQSEAGRELLQQYQLPEKALNTVVLIAGGRAFTRSTAALEIARRLDSAWPICYAAVVLPPFLRDSVYDFIARNRYRWFGKQEACMMPSPELKQRFL